MKTKLNAFPLLGLLALLNFHFTAEAQVSTVTNTNDAGPGSLRDAISNTPPGGFIYFTTNLSGATITLTSGELLLTENLTIDASALSGPVAISGNNNSRVFFITNNATVVLNALTLSNGRPVSQTDNFGGGIYNSTNCTLTLIRCLLSGNSATGGTPPDFSDAPGNGSGGAIYNAGTVTLDHCNLSGNSAFGDTPAGDPNAGANGSGGAIYNLGTVTLGYCIVLSNSASGGSSGDAAPTSGGDGSGGGIYNAGTAALGYCIVSSNSASGGNGSSIQGATGGAAGNSSGGGVYNGGTLTLSNCTLSANSGNGGGGGDGLGYAGGSIGGSASGGGVYNAGTLRLDQNTLSGNSTTGGGGGNSDCPCAGAAGGNATGGGVYDAGTATLNQNTLSGNSATGGSGGSGGSGNGATGAANVGGIYTTSTNATLHNCLIALNLGGGSPDASGSFISQGHNLVGATNGSGGIIGGVNGDLAGTTTAPINPLLSPLANYGGFTPTLALQPGSPAIDAGDDSVTNAFATDQRGAGFPRLCLRHVDIGAYEFGDGDSTPTITSLTTGSVTVNPATLLGNLTVGASVNPNSIDAPATAWVQYGPTTGYGLTTTPIPLVAGTSYVPLSQPLINLAPELAWHYRWVAISFLGTNFSPDLMFTTAQALPFNLNGSLRPSGGGFQLSFSNLNGLGFTVLGSTNLALPLSNWTMLGPVVESPAGSGNYQFSDPQATNYARRFYSVRSP